MGVRRESQKDAIAFIHAQDADSWARFLQNKLSSDAYKIESFSQPPHLEDTPSLISSAQTCAVLVSPTLLEDESFWLRSVSNFHARTVILFLGADRKDFEHSLGAPLLKRVLSHRWLEVDGSKESVSEAIVKLIETYEALDEETFGERAGAKMERQNCPDDEDIYDYPPPPRQHNSIIRVIPTVLYEHSSREVLILTERDADEPVAMVTETGCGPSRHIQLEHITPSAYVAKLPENFDGEVKFMLLAGEHTVGHASVHIYSRMEQLRHILKAELSPLTLLCSTLGLSTGQESQAEELDLLLSQRIRDSQLPADLLKILNAEDQATPDQENCHWPTLLHFAAEFNLKKVCEALLRFPVMIHAACMENKDGLFPCQLAEKNGHRPLQKLLVQYVKDMRLRRSAADSGISLENLPPPQRHRSSSLSHFYVNDMHTSGEDLGTFDDDYIDMSHPCFYGYSKPRSMSEGCVKTPYAREPSEACIKEENEGSEPPPLQPKIGRAKSAANEYSSQGLFIPPEKRRPDSGSSDNSDTKLSETTCQSSAPSEAGAIGGTESRVSSSSGCEFHLGSQPGSRPVSSSRPVSNASSSSSQSDYMEPTVRPDSATIDDEPFSSPLDMEVHESPTVMRTKEGKRRKSVQDKISHFFAKMKASSKRHHSASDGDLPVVGKGHKKPVVYTRHSTMSTSSDPLGYQSSSSLRVKSQSSFGESDRDSGAVCDESSSPQRRQSIRVQRARNEDLSERPSLPARGNSTESKETFVSFIK